MTEFGPNIPELRKAVEWVEAQEALPEWKRQWDQGQWLSDRTDEVFMHIARDTEQVPVAVVQHSYDCKTGCCLAGYVALSHGWTPALEDGVHSDSDVEKAGEIAMVPNVAADILGIEADSRLFAGGNTAADIRRIAEEIAEERL